MPAMEQESPSFFFISVTFTADIHEARQAVKILSLRIPSICCQIEFSEDVSGCLGLLFGRILRRENER